jgi:hypothetical protein
MDSRVFWGMHGNFKSILPAFLSSMRRYSILVVDDAQASWRSDDASEQHYYELPILARSGRGQTTLASILPTVYVLVLKLACRVAAARLSHIRRGAPYIIQSCI